MTSRRAAIAACLLLSVSNGAFAGIVRSLVEPEQIERAMVSGQVPVVELEQDPEKFRAQLLDFLHETEDALSVALAHPAIGPRLAEGLDAQQAIVPLSPETYAIVEEMDWDELAQLRDGLAGVRGALAAPALLRESLSRLPAPSDPALAASAEKLADCSDVYTEFNRLTPLAEAKRGVTIGRNIIGLAKEIMTMIADIGLAASAVCETPIDIPTSCTALPFIIIKGVFSAIDLALALTLDELGFQMTAADRCINLPACPPQGFSERFRQDEAPSLAGRGCDERDNNCTGGIDEIAEDDFDPVVSIDAALTARCYPDPVVAEAAARLAVHAYDDCTPLAEVPDDPQEGLLDIAFNYVPSSCEGTLIARATDKAGNESDPAAGMATVVIDDTPPEIALQDLSGNCQPTVEAARLAFGFGASDACTAVQSEVRVVEKECVADFQFDAVDGCGNRTTMLRSVRLDAAAPAVDIERLLLPEVEGRYCFASETDAVTEVAEATAIDDNCTDPLDLTFSTVAEPAGGNACDRLVTSTATDGCGLSSFDSLVARLDTTAPVVSCSVTQPILWPADLTMRDVGFSMTVNDDCGTRDVAVDVAITSDEPTSLDLAVQGDSDLSPDARIVGDGLGGILRIELRAERQQTQSADGRVYRIRVTATDGCGNSDYADCFVSVPKSLSNNRSELVNSGQNFDATVAN